MARPVEYNKENVLQAAMELFWRKGYEAASISDLIVATGLTTRSLYNIFGSKNGLFAATLDKYYSVGYSAAFTALVESYGLGAIKDYISRATSGTPINGCMYVNTISEQNSVEKDCLDKALSYFTRLESTFVSKLNYAQKHEDFKGSPKLIAKQIITMLLGLAVYSKTNHNIKERKEIIMDFLSKLGI